MDRTYLATFGSRFHTVFPSVHCALLSFTASHFFSFSSFVFDLYLFDFASVTETMQACIG